MTATKQSDNGFRLDRPSYKREDGAVMIEIAPGQFVSERIARGLPPIEPKPETKEEAKAAGVKRPLAPAE